MKDAQTLRIQRYLAQGKSLTPLEALRRFNTLRLGARVYELRAQGWPILSKLVSRNGKHVASYWIEL